MSDSRPRWLEELDETLGSQWVRCALQVNPYAYLGRHGHKTKAPDEQSYNEEVTQALVAARVGLAAVTDHYRIAESRSLLAAIRDAGIVALPGVEAATIEGLHFLVIFDAEASDGDVERFIGECKVRDKEGLSPLGEITATELLRICEEQRIACIGAHVTQDNGLLKHVTGQTRMNIWKAPELHAVAIPGAVSAVPSNMKGILENKTSNYAREPAPAVLNAGDICGGSDVGGAGKTCRLRLAEVSQTALRHAVVDPESRVLLDSDAEPEGCPRLVAVHWDGGFLDGQTLPLSPELNVLIGAPGSGKSTVIESVRSAFDLTPASGRGREDHDGIIRSVLGHGTTISVLVEDPTPSPVRYVVERTLPNPPAVRVAETWEESGQTPDDLSPLPSIFGQHEIADLAQDVDRRTELLQKFVPTDSSVQLTEAVEALENSRQALVETESELEQVEAELRLLPAAREQLKRFKDAKVAERLKEQTLLDREHDAIERARDHLDEVRDELDDLAWGSRDPLRTDFEGLDDSPFRAELQKLDSASAKVDKAASTADRSVRAAIDSATAQVEQVFARWKERRKKADDALREIKKELEAEQIDHESFRRIQRRVDDLEALEPRARDLAEELKASRSNRTNALGRREEAEAKIIRALKKAAAQASAQLAPNVRIEIDTHVDHEQLSALVREAGGRVTEALKAFKADPSFSPRGLAAAAREGAEAVSGKWAVTDQQARKIASLPSSVLLQIEELPLRIVTSIQLNTAPEGEPARWLPLESLSKGQRAIAVLLLLLLDSESPLIVDQPEDDLDNSFVSTRVVPVVRAAKRNRQFLFSTHNANVPVLADAELLTALVLNDASTQSEIRPENVGSVDKANLRALIEQRLEGGREAFETRRRRYRLE